MIEISIVKLCCAVIAAMMAAATFGFMLASILANCKYREMQADLARRETNLSHPSRAARLRTTSSRLPRWRPGPLTFL